MKNISRRRLFRHTITGLGAITLGQVLAGCSPQAAQPTPTQAPAPTQAPTATTVPTLAPTAAPRPTEPAQAAATQPAPQPTLPQPTPTISSSPTPTLPPDMVVARGTDPAELVRQAVKAMGGMEKFIKKGAKVVVKPNICVAYGNYENAYTSNPWVVGALVKLCLEAGAASVRVFDAPFNGTAANAYLRSGIEEQVKAAGGEMVQMAGYKYVPTKLAMGKELKNIGIYDEILKADAIINVPIAKHHSLAGLTLAMKNLMGLIDDRMSIHPNFSQRLPDLASQIKPVLNVVDAVRILMDNGPASGTKDDVKKLDTIILTQDIVAADAYGTTLFGKKPTDLKNVVTAADMKLGRMDINNLKITEIKVGG
jgi:uncharacterized protein (DUF362 family)